MSSGCKLGRLQKCLNERIVIEVNIDSYFILFLFQLNMNFQCEGFYFFVLINMFVMCLDVIVEY